MQCSARHLLFSIELHLGTGSFSALSQSFTAFSHWFGLIRNNFQNSRFQFLCLLCVHKTACLSKLPKPEKSLGTTNVQLHVEKCTGRIEKGLRCQHLPASSLALFGALAGLDQARLSNRAFYAVEGALHTRGLSATAPPTKRWSLRLQPRHRLPLAHTPHTPTPCAPRVRTLCVPPRSPPPPPAHLPGACVRLVQSTERLRTGGG